MRAPSWLIGSKAAMAEPETPKVDDERLKARLNAVRRSFRRRLTDRIEDLFEEACLSGDLETAEALLAAYERAGARAPGPHGRDRRVSEAALNQLRDSLAQRRQVSIAA